MLEVFDLRNQFAVVSDKGKRALKLAGHQALQNKYRARFRRCDRTVMHAPSRVNV